MVLCEKLGEEKEKQCILMPFLLFLFSGIFLLVMTILKESWWYDTMLCFAFGSFYAINQEKIDEFCKSIRNYVLVLVLFGLYYILCCRSGGFLTYNLRAMIFTLLLTVVTMRVKIKNQILTWLGRHSFYIYIYMRLPMILLKKFEIFPEKPLAFGIAALISTCILAWAMNLFHKKTDWLLLK